MIFFLNRGLILEQEVVKALKKYFDLAGVPEYFKNFTVNITNEHPFAKMYLSETPQTAAVSLFPVVVVATESDSKPGELTQLVDSADNTIIEPDDLLPPKIDPSVAAPVDTRSAIERRYDMITPQVLKRLQTAMDERKDKRIFGTSLFIRRRENISIEIWAENPQLKNELYELVRLFVCGFMRDYLTDLYKGYFNELDDSESSPLTIFDSSVRGQRSNNFNLEFGIELCGGQITFEADYVIEQTVIDTEIVDAENILLEVINHVKGHEHRTRERIIGDDTAESTEPANPGESGGAAGDGGQSGESGAGETGNGEAEGNAETEGAAEETQAEHQPQQAVDG